MIDIMVKVTHARPIRVAWRDAEGSPEVPLWALHRIMARDPSVGLALLCGLHDWETPRVVSGVWVPSRHFRPEEWARMQDVGYAVGKDEGMWGSMEGGGVSDGEEGGGGVHHHHANPAPLKAKPQPNPPKPSAKKGKVPFESSDNSDDEAIPRAKKPKPSAPGPPARPAKAVPAPKPAIPPKPPPPPDQDRRPQDGRPSCRSDRWDGRPRPLPPGVEKGTARGVDGRRYGAVLGEYSGGTTPYEVSRSLLFPTLEEAELYREEARAGKKKPKPAAPTNEESNPPNANPTTYPLTPLTPLTPHPDPRRCWTPLRGPVRYEGPG